MPLAIQSYQRGEESTVRDAMRRRSRRGSGRRRLRLARLGAVRSFSNLARWAASYTNVEAVELWGAPFWLFFKPTPTPTPIPMAITAAAAIERAIHHILLDQKGAPVPEVWGGFRDSFSTNPGVT